MIKIMPASYISCIKSSKYEAVKNERRGKKRIGINERTEKEL